MRLVIPAILAHDTGAASRAAQTLHGFTDWIHLDITDGVFVPDTTVPLKTFYDTPLNTHRDIHLMVHEPRIYFEDCLNLKATRVVFHVEASGDITAAITAARRHGFQVGLAIKAETPTEALKPYIQDVDAVLVMSVTPGKQGQHFIPSVLQKIVAIRALSPRTTIGIDGGINQATIDALVNLPVDYAIVGSALVQSQNPAQTHLELQQKLNP